MNPSNRRTGQSKTEAFVSQYQKEFNNTRMVYAQLAPGKPEEIYNQKSNILAIRYNEQIYWTYLVGKDNVYPNRDLHDVLWLHVNKVTAIPNNKPIPDSLPDTMPISISFLIPRMDRPATISSQSTAALDSNYVEETAENAKIYVGRQSEDPTDRTGLRFGERNGNILLKGPGSEILLTDEGINLNGKIINNEMNNKSIFAENPISYLIPSTVVTFPAAYSYLPDFNKIEGFGELLADLNDMRNLISTLSKL